MNSASTLSTLDRAVCAACSALLSTGAQWAHAARLFVFTATLGLAVGERQGGCMGVLAALLVLGLIHHYVAVRVSLDARLFDRLVRGQIVGLSELDEALQKVLSVPASKMDRNLAARVAGARRLYFVQVAITVLIAGLNGLAWRYVFS